MTELYMLIAIIIILIGMIAGGDFVMAHVHRGQI